MQVTRREGALAGAIHVGSLMRGRGREEHQGSFVLLPYQGSHAHTNTYKYFSCQPIQPARLSPSEDRGCHLSRHRFLAPSATREAAGWRQGHSPFYPQLPPPAL
ncbi:hypothetical protein VPH35_051967 [Triticum aestivum]